MKVEARSHLFVLDVNGDPIPCSDVKAWGDWVATATDRRLASTVVPLNSRVITHFLGMDVSDTDAMDRPPMLWETRIFGGPLDGALLRYASKADALAGHQRMCAHAAAAVRFRWSNK